MKITVISIFFPPEKGAASNRIYNMSVELQKMGHDIEVITALPNYPFGKIYPEYRFKIFKKESVDNIKVKRYRHYPSNSKRPLLRIISMVSFSISLFFAFFTLLFKRPDLIIVNSPPLLSGFTAVLFAKLLRIKCICNVSDLWPVSALELGAIKKGRFYSILESIERVMYKCSTAILTQSEESKDHINTIVTKPIYVFRNLSKPVLINEGTQSETQNRKLVYAGLLGLAQGVHDICRNINFNTLGIEFHIYGDGNEKDNIVKHIEENPDCNIYYHNMIPSEKVPKMLEEYHAMLIPLSTHIYGALPSKVFLAIACNMPIIFCGEGEGAKIVSKNNLGWVGGSKDYVSLDENIKNLSSLSKSDYQKLKQHCYAMKENKFDYHSNFNKLNEFIQKKYE